jgi:segregation and condensation protein B
VNCDYAVQKLLEKELVVISGRKEDAVGKPLLYSTSKNFMDYFGINSASDLPKIKEVLDNEIVEATRIEKEEESKTTSENEVNNAGKTIDVG